MTDDQAKAMLRELVSENVRSDNKEFQRQIRDGEQDDGPYMAIAFAVWDFVQENYLLLSQAGEVTDE